MTPWAYRDELPKHEVGGLTGWEQAALLGVMVDEKEDRTDYECKLPIALGPPHPDALLLNWIRESSQVVRTAAPLGAFATECRSLRAVGAKRPDLKRPPGR